MKKIIKNMCERMFAKRIIGDILLTKGKIAAIKYYRDNIRKRKITLVKSRDYVNRIMAKLGYNDESLASYFDSKQEKAV